MDEREVKNEYKQLKKDDKFSHFIVNIERIKSSITPKKNMELKTLLVGASRHEGSLLKSSLRLLDKKINDIDSTISKEGMENQEMTKVKIQRAQSIRTRKLKKRFNKTRRFKKNLSPIQEGSRESRSRSASESKKK
jgi:hypothetical protein